VYIADVLLPFEARNVLKVAIESHKCKNNDPYHIAQNFGGKKHWRIWRMNLYLPMFFCQLF